MDIKKHLKELLTEVVSDIGATGVDPEVTPSADADHGEYTSNIAMRLAGQLKKPPMEIGLQVKEKILQRKTENSLEEGDQKIGKQDHSDTSKMRKKSKLQDTKKVPTEIVRVLRAIDRVDVQHPGFVNIFLTGDYLSSQIQTVLKEEERYGTARKVIPIHIPGTGKDNSERSDSQKLSESKTVMVEFAHPNTHKAFHIGHLRNITTGESIVRLLEAAGYRVIRANYQGDVGMHIAKALYGILELEPYKTRFAEVTGTGAGKITEETVKERVEFLGKAYAAGSQAYESDETAKAAIKDYNYLVYAAAERLAQERGLPEASTDYLSFVTGDKGKVDTIYQAWKETRQWSLDYFEMIYTRVGSRFDRYYFESECLSGVDKAREAVKQGVLETSDGAIIFNGKPYDLDTRVFVNSLGLPTYEGKELALSVLETSEHGKLSHIIHCVGPEQSSFFQVTFKAEELMGIVDPGVQYHLAYGWVRLKHGKMSSRTGQVVLGEWLLDEAKRSIYEILDKSRSDYPSDRREEIAKKAAAAAVKYAFLKVSTNQEIAFDLKESVAFDGDSGPYLLYSYARCKSVLRKADSQSDLDLSYLSDVSTLGDVGFNPEEKQLARLITYFPDIVADAAANLAPNTLALYLFRLAQAFNLFYQKHTILGAQEASQRLALTAATAQVLKNGLGLLGIETVERM